MSEHTPGPWICERVNPNGDPLIEAGEVYGGLIATAWHAAWGSGGSQDANARLIAAAPELLEAAQGLVEWAHATGVFPDADSWGNAPYLALVAAIDKATGVEVEA